MGVIMSGILSKVSGKVAGVVGGSWKDKAYLRAWVKPANPQTVAQTTQREKFTRACNFAKPLVGQIFNAYTDRFQKTMSGFNYFIKRNLAYFVLPVVYASIDPTEGPLSYLDVTSATLGGVIVTVLFNPNYGNNGLPTDEVFFMCYDASTGVFYFPAAPQPRSGGSIVCTVAAGTLAANLHVWTFAAQRTAGIVSMISDSYYSTVT
jgi:hypothetical protein